MEKIAHKLRNSAYQSLEEIVTDFVLMFDNACKYNEPGKISIFLLKIYTNSRYLFIIIAI